MDASSRASRLRVWLALTSAAALALALAAPFLAHTLRQALGDAVHELPVPFPVLVAAQLAQALVVTGVMVAVGTALAPRVGLHAPLVEAWAERRALPAGWPRELGRAAVVGSVGGLALMAVVRFVFLPVLPDVFSDANATASPLVMLGAVFYGGVIEELGTRWGLLVLVAWLLRKARAPDAAAFWGANVGAAVLFGAGHLPLAAGLAGGLTPVIVAYVLVANASLGLVFGWLFRRHGLEAAMVAHAAAGIWLHVVPALFP